MRKKREIMRKREGEISRKRERERERVRNIYLKRE
jgi:hypothetical protein